MANNTDIMKAVRNAVMPLNKVTVRGESLNYANGHYLTDVETIAVKYAEIMDLLGIPVTADNEETPIRVAKALVEMTQNVDKPVSNLDKLCTTFSNKAKGVQLEQEEIEFASMCSHHHLPFFGKVRITYIAGNRIIGLSKFNRVVDFFSKKPQVQEDMTQEIGNYLVRLLSPVSLKVELYDCYHTCMCSRGVHSRATTKTTFIYAQEEEII